jgi:hypothetical protein
MLPARATGRQVTLARRNHEKVSPFFQKKQET